MAAQGIGILTPDSTCDKCSVIKTFRRFVIENATLHPLWSRLPFTLDIKFLPTAVALGTAGRGAWRGRSWPTEGSQVQDLSATI